MFTLKVKNNRNETLSLTNNPNYIVYKLEGLTPPRATINTSVSTTTDGSTVNSARVESRNVVIYMTIEGAVEANRINLYKYFPLKREITLYYRNGTRNVYIQGIVEAVECDPFAKKQVAQISILCPKPYFRAIEDLVTSFRAIKAAFQFPFAIEETGVPMSELNTNVRNVLVNNGDVESGLTITLYATGRVYGVSLYDVLNQTHITLNMLMEASDLVTINTNAKEKSITLTRNGKTTNILSYMTKDSKWFTLQPGENIFTYDCMSGMQNLQIDFVAPVLYEGV